MVPVEFNTATSSSGVPRQSSAGEGLSMGPMVRETVLPSGDRWDAAAMLKRKGEEECASASSNSSCAAHLPALLFVALIRLHRRSGSGFWEELR